MANNNPNALMEVTPRAGLGVNSVPMDNHQVGVWYDAAAGEWSIFNEDGTPMPLRVYFNVMAFPYAASFYNTSPGFRGSAGFVQTATPANTSGYITFINTPSLNGHPSAKLIVTQNWNPGGIGGVYNPHAIGVWYDWSVGEWTIYNEDFASIPGGASFNVLNIAGSPAVTLVASSSNASGASACYIGIVDPVNTYNFVTHVYSGYFADVAFFAFNYTTDGACIVDGSGNAISSGATFFMV